jgi:hypothetical protein
MNPGTVLGQSIAACVVLSALAALGRPTLALVLASAGLGWAAVLNRAYAIALGRQGRTPRRRKGDRAIARQLSVSYGIPIGIAFLMLLTGWDGRRDIGPIAGAEVQGLLSATGAMLVIWLASSHVDWYYIRPRIDGVVVDPPCMTSRDTRWKGVTRKWYIHRAIASVLTMVWAVAAGVIITVMLNREWASGIGAAGGFAAVAGVILFFLRPELRSAAATHHGVRSPRWWVGDDLYYATDAWQCRGFVLHVAVPVTKLVPLDADTGALTDDLEPYEEDASRLDQARLRPRPFTGCRQAGTCQKLNRECVHGQARDEVGRSHALVV